MSVSLSPLVLLNISDSLQRGLSRFGVLRGYSFQGFHILNSFEVPVKESKLDQTYITERNSLMAQVYPEEGGLIGCYAIDDELNFSSLQEVMSQLKSQVGLVLSPKQCTSKDGKYFKVYNAQGDELRVDIMENGQEAVNTVLALKDGNNEFSKSRDMVETQRDVLKIIQERVTILKSALQTGKLDYAALRKVNSLCHKLKYTVDDDIKQELVELENDYKLVLNTGLAHENLNILESATTNMGRLNAVTSSIAAHDGAA